MMYVRPELVRKTEIADGGPIKMPDALHGIYIPLDMRRQTHQGGTGFPSLATAEKGKMLLDTIVARGVEVISAVRVAPLPVQ